MARTDMTMELQDVGDRLSMKQSIKAIKRETGRRSVIRRVLQLSRRGAGIRGKSLPPAAGYTTAASGEDGRRHPLEL